MIGKFINPVAGGGTPAPSINGVYILPTSNQVSAQSPDKQYFYGLGVLNSDLLAFDTSFQFGNQGAFRNSSTSISSGTDVIPIAEQSDGKILVGGNFTQVGDQTYNRIVRLNLDGTIDSSFNIGTGFSSDIRSIKVQSDGKILVGGVFSSYNGTTSNRIIRLESDGSIDATFNVGTGFNNTVRVIEIQPDGKILVGGEFTSYQGTTSNRLIRLESNGSIDATFNIGTGASSTIFDILYSSFGIYIAGSFSTYNNINSTYSRYFARLTFTGALDNTFQTGSRPTNTSYSICELPDNSVVVGGDFNLFANAVNLIRINSDGSNTSGFSCLGSKISSISSIGVKKVIYDSSDDTLLVTGNFLSFNYGDNSTFFAKLNSDGSYIDIPGKVSFINTEPQPVINSIIKLSNGKILLGGRMLFYTTSDYSPDPKVAKNIFKVDSSNQILYDGSSLSWSQNYGITITNQNNIFVNTTSSVGTIYGFNADLEFDYNVLKLARGRIGYGGNVTILIVKELADGDLLLAGTFGQIFNSSINCLVKVSQDGVVDPTFNSGYISSSNVFPQDGCVVEVLSDGKIYISHSGTQNYFGQTVRTLMKINADGTRDTSFTSPTAITTPNSSSAIIRGLVIQSDDKIVVIGNFDTYNGNSSKYIARINSNGTYDSSFIVGTGFFQTSTANTDVNCVRAIAIQSDNKVIVGGDFISYNDTLVNRIVRLNTDGTIDSSFNIGTGFDGRVSDIKIDSSGKIHVVGEFTVYNNNKIIAYCVLNPDGSMFNNVPIKFLQGCKFISIKE